MHEAPGTATNYEFVECSHCWVENPKVPSMRSGQAQVSTEPEGALRDVAMSQWEDKAVVTVRATVLAAGTMRVLVNGKPISPAGFALAVCAGAHSVLAFLSGDLRVAAGKPASALLEVRNCSVGLASKLY